MVHMPTSDPARRRGIVITAVTLALIAVGLYVAFVLVTATR